MTGVRGSWVPWKWDSPPQDTPVPARDLQATFTVSVCIARVGSWADASHTGSLPRQAQVEFLSLPEELWTVGSAPGREDGSRVVRPPAPCPMPDSVDQGQAFPTAQSAQSLPGPALGVPTPGSPQGLLPPPEAGMTSGSERDPCCEAGAGKAGPGVGAERGSMTGWEPRPVAAFPLASPASGETPWLCPIRVLVTLGPL